MDKKKAYIEWKSLFDDKVCAIWQDEKNVYLKGVSMMIFAIKREFKKIVKELDADMAVVKEKTLSIRHFSIDNKPLPVIGDDKENIPLKLKNNRGSKPMLNIVSDSPEIFEVAEHNGSTISEDNAFLIIDDDDFRSTNAIDTSPELKKTSRIHFHKHNPKLIVHQSSQNILKYFGSREVATPINQSTKKTVPPINCDTSDILDSSIVACTPVSETMLSKRSMKSNCFMSKKKAKNLVHGKFNQNESCDKRKVEQLKSNSEEVYYDASENIGITEMINIINKDDDIQMDCSSVEIEANDKDVHIRNKALNDLGSRINVQTIESNKANSNKNDVPCENVDLRRINEYFAKAQGVPEHQLEAEPIIRGKARQKLPGWACKECEKFYVNQGMNEEEMMALNKCSKHRGMYRPREETLPGFWDLNMATQESESD